MWLCYIFVLPLLPLWPFSSGFCSSFLVPCSDLSAVPMELGCDLGTLSTRLRAQELDRESAEAELGQAAARRSWSQSVISGIPQSGKALERSLCQFSCILDVQGVALVRTVLERMIRTLG